MDPRLTGVPHGQLLSAQARCETQMFWSRFASPGPSGRVDAKYRLKPSLDSAACWSLNDVLIAGPRFTGSDQAEKLDVWSATRAPAMLRSDSVPHPMSKTRQASELRTRDVVLIDPSYPR